MVVMKVVGRANVFNKTNRTNDIAGIVLHSTTHLANNENFFSVRYFESNAWLTFSAVREVEIMVLANCCTLIQMEALPCQSHVLTSSCREWNRMA